MKLEEIYGKINSIKNDYVSGSSEITLNAIEIFFSAVQNIPYEHLEQIKNTIISSKPSMTALKNIINYSYKLLTNNENHTSNELEKYVKMKFSEAKDITIKKAVEYLNRNNIQEFYTCSYSSTVYDIFQKYFNIQPNITINLINSIWKSINYAEIFQNKLRNYNIPSKIIDNNDINQLQNSIGIIGADSVLTNGNVINGTPSKALAGKLYNKNTPLIITAESFKVNDEIIIGYGFEEIPAKFIHKIISDDIF